MSNEDLNWENLANRINERMAERGLSQAGLARLANVSDATISSLCLGKPKAYRRLTFRMVENALGWLSGSIDDVLAGGKPRTLLGEYQELEEFVASNPHADKILDGEDGPSPFTMLEWMRQELVERGELEGEAGGSDQPKPSESQGLTFGELEKVVSNLEDRIAILERLIGEVINGDKKHRID